MAQTPVLTLEKPTVEDGAAMWQLAEESSLDSNSSYKYIMMCEYFDETCIVAKEDDELVGFITGFIPPKQPDTLFIWQVGVAESQRGKGLALDLLLTLCERHACEAVNYVEATVTPSNIASQSLFKKLARTRGTSCRITDCFGEELFPDENHEEEKTFRIGPLKS
ncbi:L-2,4-diaminobutyric acid acetyltransferase [Bacillus sp. JCM 19046]|uniref:L-2,4-diaminobutyric acid acetyltransferase n=1 Tax=Shouchella xiaoxiensis TaxID=766895 RepID=A0ABS2SVN9_9BACI|nr:diaminobutyrate acetyltransferase [Shouchella xiaoxiensis]MBM7838875.1 L-2,4-diaminobutyric acid acetyltransferase [Shouchella xiaoxiensis]GAF11532.1 L-2,4-diaminobutyric acid acetyltransferase [Bacillus sp. JCM 19045]GAF17427.1 L-2,4-diaminobutyric acid acetyltransferase [Bacillus sp. JCM 19046]